MDDLPFLDLTAPGFSTRSKDVLAARELAWCARTPFGFAVLRHHEAGQLLRDRRLRQGSHAWPDIVGIKGAFAKFWSRSIISKEGPEHKALRQVAQVALAENHITKLTPEFESIAQSILTNCRKEPAFDFVRTISEPFAGQAIARLMDRDPDEAPAIAKNASALGLAMGPDAKMFEDTFNTACERLLVLADDMLSNPPSNGFVSRMLTAAKTLNLTDHQALIDLIVIAIFGGVDTTRAQLAFTIHLFAQHPEQWEWLRANRNHIPNALDEVIRTRPTTTWASREALETFTHNDVTINKGDTLHILVHATGTDPQAGGAAGFDIRMKRKSHFGFGGGAHHCLGHFVARTDMAAALGVMLDNWRGIEIVGTPEFLPDSGNTSPTKLIVKPDWDT